MPFGRPFYMHFIAKKVLCAMSGNLDFDLRIGSTVRVMEMLARQRPTLESTKIVDPLWTATLPCGTVVSLGPNSSVNPTEFNQLSVFYSHSEQTLRKRPNRQNVVVPIEAKHHKYHHSIPLYGMWSTGSIMSPYTQYLLENIRDFYDIIQRDTVSLILKESKRMCKSALIQRVELPPVVKTKTFYMFSPSLQDHSI